MTEAKDAKARPRILIVEDEVVIALDLQSRVERLGFSVTANVTSAEAALKCVAADPPDLVVMDIMLQGEMDGIEAAELIRARWDIPVVFATAHADQERLERAKLSLPFGYLLKPFQDRDVKITVDLALYVAQVDAKHQRAEEALKREKRNLDRIIDLSPFGIGVYTPSGGYVRCNQAFKKLFKAEPPEGYCLFDDPIAEKAGFTADLHEKIRKGEVVTILDMCFNPNDLSPELPDNPIVYNSVAFPVWSADGEIENTVIFFDEITERKKAEDVLRKRERELEERVKELSCFYALSRLVEENEAPDDIFQGVADLIPGSLQYPDITCARITLGESEYTTESFRSTKWRLEAAIVVAGAPGGQIEVCYLQERPEADEGPFLKEERRLVKAMAERLGRVVERHQAEDAVLEQARHNEMLLDSLPQPAMLINKERIILACNRAAAEAGAQRGVYCWQGFGKCQFIPEQDRVLVEEHNAAPLSSTHCHFCQADECLAAGCHRRDPEVQAFGRIWDTNWVALDDETYLHYAIDVTEVKEREAEQKKAEERIAASLEEKETLLREIHHRVKNNLQVVISLLRLQSDQITEPQARAAFADSQNRILAMAKVHDTLHRSESLSAVSCREYLGQLVEGIASTYRADRVQVSTEVCDATIHIDQAVPLGVIVNELTSNAIKHAFPDSRRGQVRVVVRADEHEFELEVSDDGVGMPEETDLATIDTLGFRLVTALAKSQLGGTLEFSRDNGTRFVVTFERKRRGTIVR